MPTVNLNKFNNLSQNLDNGLIDLNADNLMVLLTNTAPNVGDTGVNTTTTTCTVYPVSNAAEIAAANGYTKGGITPTNSGVTQSGGISTSILQPASFTASGGSFGPARYLVVYDNTALTSATRPGIGWYDYGASITLNSGESLDVPFDTTNGFLQTQ